MSDTDTQATAPATPTINLAHPFNGHVITVDPRTWTFTASGPEFEGTASAYTMTFSSFEAAKAEINKRVDESARIRAKNITLEARVLDERGERVTITRINRANGEVIGLSTRRFYPDVRWIFNALADLKRLRSEVVVIEKNLKDVQLDRSRTYGRIDAEDYGRKIDALQKEIEEKTAKANAMAEPTPAPEVESA